jgi:hypothetical protein
VRALELFFEDILIKKGHGFYESATLQHIPLQSIWLEGKILQNKKAPDFGAFTNIIL